MLYLPTFLFFLIFVNYQVYSKTPKKETLNNRKKNYQQPITQLEEFVVTATKAQIPLGPHAISVTIIPLSQKSTNSLNSIGDILRENIPSLDVTQNGGDGSPISVFIRGAKSEHTLVLIDGIEVNDPINPSRSFDFSHLTLEDIDRIEIIRGSQSTLYGSDAIGGVINIITKSGKKKDKITNYHLMLSMGSHDTTNQRINISGNGRIGHYSMSVSHLITKGYSAALVEHRTPEADGYSNYTYNFKGGLYLSKIWDLGFMIRLVKANIDMDAQGGEQGDDLNYTGNNRQLVAKLHTTMKSSDNRYRQTFILGISDHLRKTKNEKDILKPTDYERSTFKGRIYKSEWQHRLLINSSNTVIAGIEFQREEGSSDYYMDNKFGIIDNQFNKKFTNSIALYGQEQFAYQNSFFTTLGLRLDHHRQFGSTFTYRIAPSYLFNNSRTKIRSSYGTGFKTPSLFQFYSTYGSEDLLPEKSQSFDLGIDQIFNKNLLLSKLSFSFFYINITDMIDYDFNTQKYNNLQKATIQGSELSVKFEPLTGFSLNSNYTYTHAMDENDKQLLKRPAHKAFISLDSNLAQKTLLLSLIADYKGKRFDIDTSSLAAQRISLSPYTLFHIRGSYKLSGSAQKMQKTQNEQKRPNEQKEPNKQKEQNNNQNRQDIEIFFRLNNVLNRSYQESFGYSTAGRTLFAGIQARF